MNSGRRYAPVRTLRGSSCSITTLGESGFIETSSFFTLLLSSILASIILIATLSSLRDITALRTKLDQMRQTKRLHLLLDRSSQNHDRYSFLPPPIIQSVSGRIPYRPPSGSSEGNIISFLEILDLGLLEVRHVQSPRLRACLKGRISGELTEETLWIAAGPVDQFEVIRAHVTPDGENCYHLRFQFTDSPFSSASPLEADFFPILVAPLQSVFTLYLDKNSCLRRATLHRSGYVSRQALICGLDAVQFSNHGRIFSATIAFSPKQPSRSVEFALALPRIDPLRFTAEGYL